ncbi:fungal-specific transcription factor domain-containing protein [Aspergillus pseudoustus]|uniref:Fungal-specific transcription factor domain-containing protein n=1 Tax=Aspergillus pseudoustus TaxID=1810923 RepID=A0ABR4JK14_9EURO
MDAEAAAPTRSRKGCWTCRQKKVKCDESRPRCQRCLRLHRHCDYSPRARKPYVRRQPRQRIQRRGQEQEPQDSQAQQALSPQHPGSEENPLPCQTLSVASATTESSAGTLWPKLSEADHDAIHCFRTVVSRSVDTKDTEFSVPAIIASLAKTEAMALHMICALGHHERRYQEQSDCSATAAVEHYSSAMILVAQALQQQETQCQQRQPNLDSTLVTLWLMIVYEQRYGDGQGHGLIAHLRGAAIFLQHRLGNLRRLLEHNFSEPAEMWHISPLAGRMIIWIAFLDAGAESHQLGGEFNRALGVAMAGLGENEIMSRLRGYTAIHRYSTSLHMCTWGASYPQAQLLEDLESREVFSLYGECGQMRHVLAQLAVTATDPLPVARALHDINQRYNEILTVAPRLNTGYAGGHEKFVINTRYVVPFYHALVLWYFRITAPTTPFKSKSKQQHALDEILTLAYQAYRDEGEPAMARIAWPLFMTAIETDDLAHQDWISSRFAYLRSRGENYRRAEKALLFVVTEQRKRGGRVDFSARFESGELERFVI